MKNFKQVNDFRNPIINSAYRGILADAQVDEMMDEDEFKYPVGRKNECETCGGHGFILKRYQHPLLTNPSETKCPDCLGTGEIENE